MAKRVARKPASKGAAPRAAVPATRGRAPRAAKKTASAPARARTPKAPAGADAENRAQLEGLLKEVSGDLDALLEKELKQPPAEFTDEDGWRYFSWGDVEARVIVNEVDDDVWVRVEAPVMELPAEAEHQLPVLLEAMSYNAASAGHARLGVSGRALMAVTTQPATNIGPDDLPQCMEDTVVLAAVAADRLVTLYGEKKGEKKKGRGKKR